MIEKSLLTYMSEISKLALKVGVKCGEPLRDFLEFYSNQKQFVANDKRSELEKILQSQVTKVMTTKNHSIHPKHIPMDSRTGQEIDAAVEGLKFEALDEDGDAQGYATVNETNGSGGATQGIQSNGWIVVENETNMDFTFDAGGGELGQSDPSHLMDTSGESLSSVLPHGHNVSSIVPSAFCKIREHIHSDKKILIQNIIALPSHINAKAVSLMA